MSKKRLPSLVFLLLIISIQTASSAKAQTQDQRGLVHRAGNVQDWPSKSMRYALVIGVDEYQDSQINKLEGASNDARALAEALTKYAGFPSDQVILLTSVRSVEFQPTRANILRRLSNLRQAVPKEGLLLVSFAGHGMERDGQAYLLPMDGQISGDIGLLEDSSINVKLMRERIRETGVKQVILILDACRNNPMAGRGATKSLLTDAYTRAFNFDIRNQEVTAFATLYATGVGQVAHEYREKRQGYFTWTLVEGLKGAAADQNGEVTLQRLVKYVQDTVPRRIRLDLGTDKQQIPWAEIHGYKADELVIAIAERDTNNGQDVSPKRPIDKANLKTRESDLNSDNRKPISGDPISGLWECSYGPGAFPFKLKLKFQGESVTGEHLLEGINSPIESGKWSGTELVLTIIHNKSRVRLVASLISDRLIGKKYIDGSTTPLEWNAMKK